jgi:hypothetical protein
LSLKLSQIPYYMIKLLLLVCFLVVRFGSLGVFVVVFGFSYDVTALFTVSLVVDIISLLSLMAVCLYRKTQRRSIVVVCLEYFCLLVVLFLIFKWYFDIVPHSVRTCIRCPEEAVHIPTPEELADIRTRDIFSYSYGTISILLHCWVYWKFRKPSKKLEN